MYVQLITQTSIDWTTFLNVSNQSLGYKVTRSIDSKKEDVKTLKGFVGCLGETQGNHDPLGDLSLLRHISFGFLVIADNETVNELLRRVSGLTITSSATLKRNVDLLVITGSLLNWHEAVVCCTSGLESSELRMIFDTVLLTFENMGLGQVFERYKKQSMPDQSFKLIEKQ